MENNRRKNRKALILVVDDDAVVRMVTRAVLEEFGFKVLDAADSAAALEVFRAHCDQIGLSVIDVVLPGKSGKDLYVEMRAIDPAARVLLTSGYGSHLLSAKDIDCPGVGFLPKPATAQVLIETISDLLAV